MKKLIIVLILLISTLNFNAQERFPVPAPKIRQVMFVPYITVKENIYHKETTDRYQTNLTVGISSEYKNLDLKAFYGTTISGGQATYVGGFTATYNFLKNTIFSPYVTCRLNIYDLYSFGYNPALGLALNYHKFSLRFFDGLSFKNNKFTDAVTPKSNGTTNSYNLIAATIFGASLTYNFKKF